MTRPLRLATLLLATGIASPGLLAQLPRDFALILTDSVLPPDPAFFIADTVPGGISTPLDNQGVFAPLVGVAIQPDDPATHWYTTDASSFGGVWRRELRYGTSTGNLWGQWARSSVRRLTVAGDRFVLIDDALGLATAPLAGGDPVLFQTGTFVDVASFGTDAVALRILNGLPTLVDVDLAAGTATDVGTVLGATCVALRSDGLVLLGTDRGDVLTVDRSTGGTVVNTLTTGLGSLVSIATNSFDFAVFATETDVWVEIDPVTPLFQVPTGVRILDLDVNRIAQATALQLGSGCGNSGAVPQHSLPRAPVLGDAAFRIEATDGPRSSPGALNLGLSATFSQLFGQPLPVDLTVFGFPGCELGVDAVSTVPATFDATGTARLNLPLPSQPALIGQRVFGQWFAADRGRLATSNSIGLFLEAR